MNIEKQQKQEQNKEIQLRPHRWVKGQSGNPKGRPKKPEIEELRRALNKVKKEKNKSFLEYFVEKAYEDKDYAIALFKKIIPNEVFVDKEDKKFIIKFKGEIPRPDKNINEAEIYEE